MIPGVAAAAILAIIVPAMTRKAEAQSEVTSPSRWVGRTDIDTDRFGWPGSGFDIGFTCSRLSVTLKSEGQQYLTASVNGQDKRILLQAGTNSYPIVSALRQHLYNVRLTVSSESISPITFVEAVTDGEFVPRPSPGRKILAIGDSLTAGYGVLGNNARCAPSAENQDFSRSYAANLGRQFNADVVAVAVSGNGLVRNYNDAARPTMFALYGSTLPSGGRPAPADDADVVIVFLGTNDWTQGSRPQSFVMSYIDMLVDLRRSNPRAQIYSLIGPLLAGDDLRGARNAIAEAVENRHDEGDQKVRLLDLASLKGSFGCNWHPDVQMQGAIANLVATEIQSDLGWRYAATS